LTVYISGCRSAKEDCWSALWKTKDQRTFDELFSGMQINNAGMMAYIFEMIVYFPESSLKGRVFDLFWRSPTFL
jgi:hypothetical protein